MSLIVGTAVAGGGSAPYQISRSLRFEPSDTTYLNRTFSTPTNNKIWTWSSWVKKSALGGSGQELLFVFPDGSNYAYIQFTSGDALELGGQTGGVNFSRITSAVFRDLSAWYAINVIVDTTLATANDRIKIYVNNVLQTLTGTAPTQNSNLVINTAVAHQIGRHSTSGNYYFGGYMAEVYFIDGQALTPSSFGQTNPNTGVWEPINYTGTYGTNGFELSFADNSGATSTTLGKDTSGNGNNWTPNNFVVTAGAGNDSLVDTPTNYGTDTGIGGSVRGNYSTLNPLFVNNTYPITYANGNLYATRAGGGQGGITNTFGMSSGKWYWEVVFSTYAYNIGITTNPAGSTTGSEGLAGYNGGGGTSIGLQPNGVLRTNGTAGTTYTSWTVGDIMGIALDMDGGNLYFYKNGTAINSGNPVATSLTGSTWFFITSAESGASFIVNFGQRAFAYTAPSGFKALCTQNLPTPTIGATSTTQANDYFNVVTFSGNGSAGSVTGVGFQPDFIWAKNRTNAYNHELWDAIRGVNSTLFSNSTAAQDTTANRLVSFNSDGFSYGTSSNLYVNGTNSVAWNWKANGAGGSNTSGTITSTVSASTTSGFSIVTYTGTGSNATVGHGLGVAPQMVIVKCRNNAGQWWPVWHTSLTSGAYALALQRTDGQASYPTMFNSTVPTSTVFSVGTSGDTNGNTFTYVAYCFAPVAGYSAFGSYTGNGSTDGPFVYTGFRPRYVMIKASSTGGAGYDWFIHDTARDTYNVCTLDLEANLNLSENQYGAEQDILSNGFKLRNTGGGTNGSGVTYIYAAFAESPFKYALAR